MTQLHKNKMIPAFLSFDVEPDGFQLSRSDPPNWPGYGATFEFAEQLRSDLTKRFGVTPKFGWYFRTDPQIAEVYGRPDHVLTEFPDRVAKLQAQGDYFGVHMHPIRWCKDRHLWVHDVADVAWLAHSTRFALEAFAQWQGFPALRFRAGAFLLNTIIEVIDQYGVKVDLTLEPVTSWAVGASHVPSGIDSSPITGNVTDCHTAPREPFRPAPHDFRVCGSGSGRNLVMVPLTTSSMFPEKPLWRRVVQRARRRSSEQARVLYPTAEWPSPRFFWDLVARQLQSMRRPYLSLAIRTESRDSILATRVRQLFAALPQHPLADYLRFTDPIDAAPGLV